MNALIDDVRASFEQETEARTANGPIQVIRDNDSELAVGFNAMREYYNGQILAVTRRGYRHFAGSSLPEDSDELVDITSQVMLDMILALVFMAFCDGVQIGQRENIQVQMAYHYHVMDELFDSQEFRNRSVTMAQGVANDSEVNEYFVDYLAGGFANLTHVTGFAHSQVRPDKIWDIWILLSTATISASYLAGHRMGDKWREREAISDLEIALGGGPDGLRTTGEAD